MRLSPPLPHRSRATSRCAALTRGSWACGGLDGCDVCEGHDACEEYNGLIGHDEQV